LSAQAPWVRAFPGFHGVRLPRVAGAASSAPMISRSGVLSVFRPLPSFLALAVVVGLGGCHTVPRSAPPASVATSEPLNLSDAKAAVLAYVDSGAYARDVAAVAAEAGSWIEQRAAARRPGERLAVVFDIDETVLSNLPHMRAEDFGYHPRAWADWIDSADAPALEPMLEVFRAARARDVAVLFLTGRRDPQERAGTEKNLRRAGFGDHAALRLADSRDAALRTAAEYKAAARAAWAAQGWTIIATVGDQESDLVGGHAERGFKLPNPFYRIP
jgi:Predicted secreted acid phosphatase